MSNLKSLAKHLKSVKNMQTITKSMKLVSAAKYARAEKELRPIRPIGNASQIFYQQADIVPLDDLPQHIYVAIASDRGLCGACNTNVIKMVRDELNTMYVKSKVVLVGDKARTVLQKTHADDILLSCTEVGKKTTTFIDAAKITAALFNSGYEFNTGNIIFNKFINVVKYATSMIPFFGYLAILQSPNLAFYDEVDNEVVLSYLEFSLTCSIFYTIKESAVSEHSARMSSMDSASRNAEKMMGQIGQTLNRSRQSNITNGLIEIISGAAALETKD